jgi:hypothetical protein
MEMKRLGTKIIMTVIMLILSIGWMREISLRRALVSSADFMSSFSPKIDSSWGFGYYHLGYIYYPNDKGALIRTVGWTIGFQRWGILGNGINIQATLLGDVVNAGNHSMEKILQLRRSGNSDQIPEVFAAMEPF